MDSYIDDYKEYLKMTKNASDNTVKAYTRDLKKFIEYLKVSNINELSKVRGIHISNYIYKLEKENRATSSISRSIATIHSYFKYLFLQGIIKDNPSEGVVAPKVEKKAPDILSLDEVDRLLEQPKRDNKGTRDRAMLELLYGTGIRVSELINLKVNDVNLNLSFVQCNGNNSRTIPFGSKAREALRLYINNVRQEMVKEEGKEMLFVNCFGRPLSRQGFWKIIKTYAKEINITTSITPHILRHSFGAHLIQNGANIKAVQEMMGHADLSSTQRYIKKNSTKINEVYKMAHPRA